MAALSPQQERNDDFRRTTDAESPPSDSSPSSSWEPRILLIVESYLGGQIRDASKDTLTAIHVPLAMSMAMAMAMAIMGLAVWLPLRIRPGPQLS